MTERHFRVVQLDGKKVEFGGVSITSKASPGSAARKLLTSIAHEKGLKKNKKASMPKVKFCIQEYTQGSSKKVYGPYVGHFHKYTAAELKKAKTAKGKIKFTMKPVVKLAKGNMKGGNIDDYKIDVQDFIKLIPEKSNMSIRDRMIAWKEAFLKEYSQHYFVNVGGSTYMIPSNKISDLRKYNTKKVKVFYDKEKYMNYTIAHYTRDNNGKVILLSKEGQNVNSNQSYICPGECGVNVKASKSLYDRFFSTPSQ